MSLALEKSPVKKKAKMKVSSPEMKEGHPVYHVKDNFGNEYKVERTFYGMLGSPIYKPEEEEEDLENVDTLENIEEEAVGFTAGSVAYHENNPPIPSGKLLEAAANPSDDPPKKKKKKNTNKDDPEKKKLATVEERTIVTRENNPYVNPFDIDDYVQSEKICMCCDCYPCVLDEHLEEIQARIQQLTLEKEEGLIKNNEARFQLYRFATHLLHGYLGKGVRRQLPWCVNSAIQNAFPARDGSYTGYKEASTDNEL